MVSNGKNLQTQDHLPVQWAIWPMIKKEIGLFCLVVAYPGPMMQMIPGNGMAVNGRKLSFKG